MAKERESGEDTVVISRDSVVEWLKKKKVKVDLWTFCLILGAVLWADRRATRFENAMSSISRELANDVWHVGDQKEWGDQIAAMNTNFYFRSPNAEKIVEDRLDRQARRQRPPPESE